MQKSLKIVIAGAVSFGLVVIFGFVLFDPLLRFVVKDQVSLKKRNEVRDIYLKIPFPLDFKVYFFNVTNPEEVQQGGVPQLKEVGPYCYDEYKTKIDVEDNEAEDSLTYSAFDTFQFNRNKSGDLDDDDYVTILHPVMVGMVDLIAKESPALLSIVNQAITVIFKPKDIYLRARVREILFDGVEINCDTTDFAAKAACTQMNSIPALKHHPTKKNVFLFSIFGMRNASIGNRIKVGRGISNYKDLGRVLELDGKKEITLWATERCNHFNGTDGWIIPPLLEEGEGIRIFATDMCRNFVTLPVGEDVVKGVYVRRYEGTLGDQQHNEEDKCYCSTPTTCMRKGVFDLTKCMGVPLMVTLPHFLDTDPYYMGKVKGLEPVHDDHILMIEMEPLTSTPLIVKKRVQLNLMISTVPRISIMQNLSEALHPIFWMEEGIVLEGPLLRKVKTVFLLLKIAKVFNYLGLVLSAATVAYGLFRYYKNKNSISVTTARELSNSDVNRSTNVLIATMNGLDKDKGREFSKCENS